MIERSPTLRQVQQMQLLDEGSLILGPRAIFRRNRRGSKQGTRCVKLEASQDCA